MFVKYSVFITCMYLLRDMPIVMCIFFLIQIHTFLLFNVLKREVSNVFLYIWTINYSYSYSIFRLRAWLAAVLRIISAASVTSERYGHTRFTYSICYYLERNEGLYLRKTRSVLPS